MKKQFAIILILVTIICIFLLGCEVMAELFHGPKPEDPPVTYTVTFFANGATGTTPEAKTVNTGTNINLPDKGDLSKGSDIFAGWSQSQSGGTVYSAFSSVTVTGNMNFYAQWLDSSTPQYTVTFDGNGATGGSPPTSQTVYNGTSITIPNQGTLLKSGNTFIGWNTLVNGSGTNYTAGTYYTVTGNVTLFAKWQNNNINVSSGDIESELIGTWRDKATTGSKMIITFNPNGIVWGGTDGVDKNIADVTWIAKDGTISCRKDLGQGIIVPQNFYDYRITDIGELEIKLYGGTWSQHTLYSLIKD